TGFRWCGVAGPSAELRIPADLQISLRFGQPCPGGYLSRRARLRVVMPMRWRMKMAGTSGTILCAAAAAVLATAAPARAQPDQEPLSAAAVEDFFGRMEQDAVRMVRSGAFEELLDWVTDNIAEEAT